MAKKKKNVGPAANIEQSKMKEQKTPAAASVKIKSQPTAKLAEFAFGRENYKFLLIGLAFIIVGFILMVGGGSDDPNVFSDDIFNFRRLTLAPILILIGYVIEIYAIMKKSKD